MKRFPVTVSGLLIAFAAGALFIAPAVNGQTTTTTTYDQAKVLLGMQIAPVPLNLTGKDPNSVGFGSYLVNANGDCNGCHSAGPATQFANGGNPFQGQKTVVNPATYLGGGRDFGPFPNANGNFAHIISRNLTPDYTGMAAGGMTYDKFALVMRTGVDMDHQHPTCSGPPDGTCIPAPFNGDLLQVMPWPTFQNVNDADMHALYDYLSSIPCLEGGPGEPTNRCTTPVQTSAVAAPKNVTVVASQIQLDGSMSTSSDGKPLTYLWTTPPGSPSAAILNGNTVNPSVQFATGRGLYTFLLTVTDSSGKSSTDVATVNFVGY